MILLNIGLLSGILTIFLNYCIGKPGLEFSPYEIFSSYTVWLSKRRLKKAGLWGGYHLQLVDSINRARSISEMITIRNDFKRVIYNAAEPFFTWERMIGMCPVCTGVWISTFVWLIGYTITGLVIWQELLDLWIIILISHITIRLLSKIL